MAIILGTTTNYEKAIHYFNLALKDKVTLSTNKHIDILIKIGICYK